MLTLTLAVLASPLLAAPKPDPSEAFFAPTAAVPTLRIEVDPANLRKLRQNSRAYVKVTIRHKDAVYRDVGLHLKGAAGSNRDWNDKPALTINMDKFVDDQHFHGLDKFHLNNSVQDETYMNELLFAEIFRASGVPTPRATHAMVELNGRKVGLYVLREGFDKTFLNRHFKSKEGNLYDGGFLMDIDQGLQLDSGPGPAGKDLKLLASAARTENHAERLKELEKVLNIDEFLAYWAIEVMGCDWDGYCRNRNNYRVYHDPTTDKFFFLAHGKDQMLMNINDGLVMGWGGLIARRLWETEDGRKRYIAKVKEVFEKQFIYENIAKRIDEYTLRLREPLNNWQRGAGDQYFASLRHYKNRWKARIDYLKKEIPKLKP